MNKSFVEVFAKGRWKDNDNLLRVKWGRINTFPTGLDRKKGEVEKVRAKVGYRRRPREAGDFSFELASKVFYECVHRCYVTNGIFRESRKWDPKELESYFKESIPEYAAATIKKIEDASDPNEIAQAIEGLNGMLLNVAEYDYFTHTARYNSMVNAATGKTENDRHAHILKSIFSLARNIWSASLYGSSIATTIAKPSVIGLAKIYDALLSGAWRPPNLKTKYRRSMVPYELQFNVSAKEGRPRIWSHTERFRAEMSKNLSFLETRDKIISESGVVPRRMSRLVTDGKIFERAIPEYGAAILIDASGSMSISEDTIRQIIEIAPASWIGMYFGGAGKINGVEHSGGFIVELAENGIAADNINKYRLGGGNQCDGIALRFLGTKPEPRFWISDGYVTGPGDADNRVGIYEDTAWCLREFKINWVNTRDTDEILDILREEVVEAALA